MPASLHIAPVFRKLTQDRFVWTPGWTESHSFSYGLNRAGSGEDQVQAYRDKSVPG